MTRRTEKTRTQNRARRIGPPDSQGLYDPRFEHEACGVGFVVNIKGKKSHSIIQQAVQALVNLDHRGACGCEANTGDGAGILIQTPHDFLRLVSKEARITLPGVGEYGVGMVFLPPDAAQQAECQSVFDQVAAEEGQPVLGWRTIPTNNNNLGQTAKASEPCMRQVFLARNPKLTDPMAFERKLYVIRKRAENAIRYAGKVAGGEFFYLSSLSHRTLVYKGMLLTTQLPEYYPDLSHPAWSPRWPWCTRGSARTRSQAGIARIPTGSWRITGRSTRCAGTSIGCTRGRRCLPPSCSEMTSRRSCL
jgi:glutamate synthase (ferredoxin)